MIAVISFVWFDTEQNERHQSTMDSFCHLFDSVDYRHRIVAVDNGSEDPRSRETIQWIAINNADRVQMVHIQEPNSTAYGVNTGWHLYHNQLRAKEMVAVKYDSDIIVHKDGETDAFVKGAGWLEACIDAISSNHRIAAIGPKNPNQSYTGQWLIEQHDTWMHTPFVYGAVSVRSPMAFQRIGYMRQPYGRWGWDDHYDCLRINHLRLKCATLNGYTWEQIAPKGCLTEEEKHIAEGGKALMRLKNRVETGDQPVYEGFKP